LKNKLKRKVFRGFYRAYQIAKTVDKDPLNDLFPLLYLQALRAISESNITQKGIVPGNDSLRTPKLGFFAGRERINMEFASKMQQSGHDIEVVLEKTEQCMGQIFPSYVRTVGYDTQLAEKYQKRFDVIAEMQKLYEDAFDKHLPADIAFVLAQHIGHLPLIRAMKRYDAIQLSEDTIRLGMFCPVPYILKLQDTIRLQSDESEFGLCMRAGYKRASKILIENKDAQLRLDQLGLGYKARIATNSKDILDVFKEVLSIRESTT
jgi:hypothetical protein